MEFDGEVLLCQLPRAVYIRFPNATWDKISDDFPEDVYPVTPVSRTWKVNKWSGISARRSGYYIVPDFGSTAHMIQGQTLDAAFADAQEVQTTPSSETHIASYIAFSRVKEMIKMWILQPFSPFLFRQGAPKGPAILMRKLRGEITAHEAANEAVEHLHETAECKKSSQKYDVRQELFRCLQCYWSGEREYMHKAEAFGVSKPGEVLPNLLMDGAWTRCEHCRKKFPQAQMLANRAANVHHIALLKNRRWNMLRTLR